MATEKIIKIEALDSLESALEITNVTMQICDFIRWYIYTVTMVAYPIQRDMLGLQGSPLNNGFLKPLARAATDIVVVPRTIKVRRVLIQDQTFDPNIEIHHSMDVLFDLYKVPALFINPRLLLDVLWNVIIKNLNSILEKLSKPEDYTLMNDCADFVKKLVSMLNQTLDQMPEFADVKEVDKKLTVYIDLEINVVRDGIPVIFRPVPINEDSVKMAILPPLIATCRYSRRRDNYDYH